MIKKKHTHNFAVFDAVKIGMSLRVGQGGIN